MTNMALINLAQLKFYATQPHACSYLPEQRATTLFLDPSSQSIWIPIASSPTWVFGVAAITFTAPLPGVLGLHRLAHCGERLCSDKTAKPYSAPQQRSARDFPRARIDR